MNTNDRRRGTLYGLAVGDALGAPVEFLPRENFEPVTDYRAGGFFNLESGQWTDDTSTALALATSIGKGWNVKDQLDEYVEWYLRGKHSITGKCFDIGETTLHALVNYRKTGQVVANRWSASNGCIMRLAPVPIKFHDLYPNDVDKLAEYADESAKTTHNEPRCRSACRYMAVAIAALINGESREKVLDPNWEVLDQLYLLYDVKEVVQGSYRTKSPDQIRGGGSVISCLEAALWAFHNANSFEEAVLRAVNLGDNADTTGAVCGQFAGAYWGESGIPERFLAGLDRKDMIEEAFNLIK